MAESPDRSRGQVVVIFAGAMLVMTLMMAVVIDLSWLWSSALKIQRAADAAALAGAVALPNDPGTGNLLALKEAKRNGYVPGGGVVVNPTTDALVNPYRMNVTITAPVGMFFMRVVGLASFDVSRTAHAEYNRPLKMGSPQQWYGVGTFEKVNATQEPDVPGPTDQTDWSPPGTPTAGDWTTPEMADDNDDNNFAISTTSDGSAQQWSQFGLTTGSDAIPTGAVIEGIEVRFRALITGSDNPTSFCQLQTNLSWNDGATWTTLAANQKLAAAEALYTIGSDSSLVAWPRPPGSGSWAFSSFTNANFRVRLTWNKTACGTNRTASVDTLEVRVTYHPMLPGPITYTQVTVPVPTPPGETVAPTTQGFWGAIITAGGVRRNGDRYAPQWYYSGSPASNPDHNPEGYDYIAEFGGSNGRVHLFDPVFCATGENPLGSGNFGAGDHWTDLPATGGVATGPVTTEFTLYNTRGTVEKSDDTMVGTPLIYTTRASDQSGEFDNPANGGPGGGDVPTGAPVIPCSSSPAIVAAHNNWVDLATGLPTGTYRVNVKSSQPGNAPTGAENMWSIYVGDDGGPGSARVYGEGRMLAYSNLTGAASTQKFYLTQIGKELQGKTMEIQLFDPGDVAGDATLRIRSPDGGVYNNVSFSYQADGECRGGVSDSCAGSGQTSIRTAVSGASSFDNSVITIRIPLPTTYGNGGLRPAGETEDGWWQVEYEVGAANDTTTWEVSILENPIHLVVE